jgi:alpha-glucosidase
VIRNINGGEARVREEARKLREADIPCSALWYYDTLDKQRNIGWPINPNYFDGEYDDVGQLTRDLKNLGYKSQTYLFPYFYVGTENYEHGASRGYFVKNRYGDTYIFPHPSVDYERLVSITRPCGMLDFTNPDAVAWYQELIRQVVVDLDFDGWMHDFGEDVPDDAVFHNGKTGAEMHNLYPVLYQKATYEACRRHKADVSYYARAGYTASQGYVMALWNGDQTISWSYDDGLPTVVPASLNLGICGCPTVGPDIAGFFNTPQRPGTVSEELWIRWLQLGALSPVMRDLVAYYPIELWTSEQTVEAFRRYARLHISLFPYIYTYALQASQTGAPILRHLFLRYPDDADVRDLDSQFLLGDELLVAPVLAPDVETWSVYLPQGDWVSWWSGERYRGPGRITVPAPLLQIPILVRAGAVIPLLPPDVDTLAEASDPSVCAAGDDHLIVELFPSFDGVETEFKLWDGTRLLWDPASNVFTVRDSPIERVYTLHARGQVQFMPTEAEGQALPGAADASLGWWHAAPERIAIASVRGQDVTVRGFSSVT